MYTEFYGFKEKPFSLVPNPNYLYLSSKHSNALSFFEYGMREKIGFVMLTGEIGIGKTTLIRHMLNKVEADMDVAVIFNTNILSEDLIHLILNEFEITYEEGISKAKALDILYAFLIKKYAAGRKVLLIIDEAQNLSGDVLEEIRMLSNLQTDEELLLQIMIVGQPDLQDRIRAPELKQFAQRISVSYHMSAMTLDETRAYVGYRLEKAGGERSVFSDEVVKKIFDVSAGIPRAINLVCDACLVYGYADEEKEISCDILDQVIEDKGGMGLLAAEDRGPAVVKKKDALEVLEKKVADMDQRIEELTRTFEVQLKAARTMAEYCQTEMVDNLKNLLEMERNRSAALEYKIGQIKGRHAFADKLKSIK